MRWIVLSLFAVGCGPGKPAGPPSGVVDPAEVRDDQLAMPWDKPTGKTPAPQPAPAPFLSAPAAAPTPPAPPTAPVPSGASPGETEMTWTADHCVRLGRKFGELALSGGMPEPMATQTGDKFAADCQRDKVGETLDRREYDCVMAATSVMSISGCAQ